MLEEQEKILVRFEKFTDKTTSEKGCWLWQGYKNKGFYGLIKIKKRDCLAHRIAYILFKEDIPSGLCVLHKCDVTLCVNPSHLFLGTNRDNVADKVSKNRQARGYLCGAFGDKNGANTHPESRRLGEKAYRAKLTIDKVTNIRQEFLEGELPAVIANRYNITLSNVHYILRRNTWKHIK